MKISETKVFAISGVQYYDFAKANLEVGDKLTLIAEPTNKYDRNAIAVYKNSWKIGFVPKDFTKIFHNANEDGKMLVSELIGVNKDLPTWNMFIARVFIGEKPEEKESLVISS